MIIKREKFIDKKIDHFRRITIKRTSYWFLGIIPLYIKNDIIKTYNY